MSFQPPHDDPRLATLPDDWNLLGQSNGPHRTTLHFGRNHQSHTDRHWITASGKTFEEALEAARHRIELYDASEHA